MWLKSGVYQAKNRLMFEGRRDDLFFFKLKSIPKAPPRSASRISETLLQKNLSRIHSGLWLHKLTACSHIHLHFSPFFKSYHKPCDA